MAEAGRRVLHDNWINLLEQPISPEELYMAVRIGEE
jgi:hypothetical protein